MNIMQEGGGGMRIMVPTMSSVMIHHTQAIVKHTRTHEFSGTSLTGLSPTYCLRKKK